MTCSLLNLLSNLFLSTRNKTKIQPHATTVCLFFFFFFTIPTLFYGQLILQKMSIDVQFKVLFSFFRFERIQKKNMLFVS